MYRQPEPTQGPTPNEPWRNTHPQESGFQIRQRSGPYRHFKDATGHIAGWRVVSRNADRELICARSRIVDGVCPLVFPVEVNKSIVCGLEDSQPVMPRIRDESSRRLGGIGSWKANRHGPNRIYRVASRELQSMVVTSAGFPDAD
jgi:hypothetical protein